MGTTDKLVKAEYGYHLMTKTRTWNAWRSMRKRCYDPNNIAAKFYSEKDINSL